MSNQTEKVSAEPPSGALTDASSTKEVVEMMRKLQRWNDARVAEGKKHQAMRSLVRPLQATLKRSGVWWHQHLRLLKLYPELLEFIGLPKKIRRG